MHIHLWKLETWSMQETDCTMKAVWGEFVWFVWVSCHCCNKLPQTKRLKTTQICCCSVTNSFLTLRPHGLQHASVPCPSASPGVCSDSCPLSQWCYLTITFSAAPSPSALSLSQTSDWEILWPPEAKIWLIGKDPDVWERLKGGGEGDDRGWDGWMASLTLCTWVWIISGSRWWTGKPGVLWSVGSQRVGHDWETELSWMRGEVGDIS